MVTALPSALPPSRPPALPPSLDFCPRRPPPLPPPPPPLPPPSCAALLSYAVADYAASCILEANKWHVREYEAFLADTARCTADALRDFSARRLFADGISLDVLVHGNASEADARALGRVVSGALLAPGPAGGVPLAPGRALSSRCVQLPRGGGGTRYVADSANGDEANCAVDLTLQIGPSAPRRDTLLALCVAVLEPRIFAQLRTNETLG